MLWFGYVLRPLQPIASSFCKACTMALPRRTMLYQRRRQQQQQPKNFPLNKKSRVNSEKRCSKVHRSSKVQQARWYSSKHEQGRKNKVLHFVIRGDRGILFSNDDSDTSICSHAAACCGDTSDSVSV
jgi:hypothetical protein